MRVKRISWKKRILAGAVAISMLVTMTPTAMAEEEQVQSVTTSAP